MITVQPEALVKSIALLGAEKGTKLYETGLLVPEDARGSWFSNIFTSIEQKDASAIKSVIKYKYTPVDIKTFIESPYYLNKKNYVYPVLLDELIKLNSGDYDEAIWTGSIGAGKCLGKDTPIVMYDGSVKLSQNIAVGDLLMGVDSLPRRVLRTTTGRDTLYKVSQTKGDDYVVNSEHILSLQYTGSLAKNGVIHTAYGRFKGDILNISVKNYLALSTKHKNLLKGWMPEKINFVSEDVYDPYLLGLWLGDGTSACAHITSMDTEIVDYLKAVALREEVLLTVGEYNKGSRAKRYAFSRGNIGGAKGSNPILTWLQDLNVLNNKHIPKKYLTSSEKDRLALLAGIIDTDGSLDNGYFDLTLVNKRLFDDVCFLSNSLGFQVNKSIRIINGSTYYRMTICGDIVRVPTQLPRKKAKPRTQLKSWRRWGVTVTDIGLGDYYGFELEGVDKLFLLGDFTVTHNSTGALYTQLYQLYLMSCLRSPHDSFGLDPSSEIVIAFQSINLTIAKRGDYGRFKHMVEMSPYFKEYFPPNKNVDSKLLFPHRIEVIPISGLETAAIGQNIISACFPATQKFLRSDGALVSLQDHLNTDVTCITLNADNSTGLGLATRAVPTGFKALVRLQFDNGASIVCTADQKFKDINHNWVQSKNAKGICFKFLEPLTQGVNPKFKVRIVKCLSLATFSELLTPVYDLLNTGDTHTFLALSEGVSGFLVASNCLEEVNFMSRVARSKKSIDGDGDFDQAAKLYNSIAKRRDSRFLSGGKLPGVLCIVSSKRYPGQFTDIKEAEAAKQLEATGKSKIYVYDKRMWDIKPQAYTRGKFRIFIGDEGRKPRILEDNEAVDAKDKHLVDLVPLEFKPHFERDITTALRDIAGKSTLATHPFIMNTEAISACMVRNDSIFSLDSIDFISDTLELLPDNFKHLDLPRYAHIDLGVTSDSAGLTIGTVTGFDRVVRSEHEPEGEMLPQYHIDGTLEVRPPKGGEILFWKIRNILYTLRDNGLNIKWVSLDTHQSVDTKQLLQQRGFFTGRLSTDVSNLPYELLKSALYDGRVSMPIHEKLRRELASLEIDTRSGKVDHPASNGGCHTGDVEVLLQSGEFISFEQLVSDYNGGITHYGYAYDSENSSFVTVALEHPRITKEVTELIELTFPTGTIRCTLDHPYRLKDGTYKEAQYLTEFDDLLEF